MIVEDKIDNIWVIGDVHGCYKTLMALVNKLPANPKLCFVGDLIDRGSHSKDVIEFIKSNNHYCVMGNHEDMMIDEINKSYDPFQANWYGDGGKATLESYNSPQDDELLQDHLQWLSKLPIYLEFPNLVIENNKPRYLVVSHSSIAKYWNSIDTISDDKLTNHVLWNRDIAYGTLLSSNGIYNIFGHTPHQEPVIYDFMADIDTGCVYNDKGYNKLTAINFPSLEIIQQENIE